ncbi:hypothetical protein ONZ45_g10067 [Pleurotus djamor]|nr:hypothetical protein ONZ45_g10067 [Pleurotus djamor]
MSKQLVLIVGAAGYTGGAIARAILKENNLRLAILIRKASTSKPTVKELVEAGAELRIGDITESPERIESHLQGVDIVISTVLAFVDQKPLIDAAKKAGVSRFIPSDFGPTAPRGSMSMHDLKLDIREYIKSLGLGHTFVEVGWWLPAMFPRPHSDRNTLLTPKYYIGSKQQKVVWSTLPTIGAFVERIIRDPRTLNQTIVVHNGEITPEEVWKVAEKVSGEDFSDYYQVPEKVIQEASAQNANWAKKVTAEYGRSLYILGDNTLANAEAAGSIDGRKLYPDIPYANVEEEAKAFYADPKIPEYALPENDLIDVLKPE